MKQLNVCIVTGTRAEFGIWRPVLRAIEASAALRLSLVVTGMHLLEDFGATVRQIREERLKGGIAAQVPMYRPGEPAAESLARATAGLARAYREVGADIVLVLGDRLEMLAAACAALAERLPIGHVHGGETAPGIWDEQIRHAITKMAHVHLCATEEAARRIRQMGEAAASVHVVGAPALDLAARAQGLGSDRTRKRSPRPLQASGKHQALVLLHPQGGTEKQEQARAAMMIAALRDADVHIHAVGPNNDPGHRGILAAYRAAGISMDMSLSQDRFWHALSSASFLIGNSSSGIIESATFGVPAINLGTRQAGRQRNINTIDAPWTRRAIDAAIHKALRNPSFRRQVARRKNLYGNGRAAEAIVKVLKAIAKKGINLEKRFEP